MINQGFQQNFEINEDAGYRTHLVGGVLLVLRLAVRLSAAEVRAVDAAVRQVRAGRRHVAEAICAQIEAKLGVDQDTRQAAAASAMAKVAAGLKAARAVEDAPVRTGEALARAPSPALRTASGWTEEMDRELLRRRAERKLPWKAVAPINGMSKTRCQERYEFLTSQADRPTPRVASPPAKPPTDGLEWLQRKKRLTPSQLLEGWAYRALYRDAGPLSMKSQLGGLDSPGGGGDGTGYALQTAIVGTEDARRELFVLQHHVLRSQPDLITVMDGVCGIGHTLRMLAGGEQIRAAELEAVLRVALDLLVAAREAARAAA